MNELYHYNHNHDPHNGQFASSSTPLVITGSGRHGKITNRDIKKAKKLRKEEMKNYRNVSNEELKRRIERILLENAYLDAIGKYHESGERYAKKMLQEAGKRTLNNMSDKGTDIVADAIRQATGIKKDNEGNGNKKKNKK